jgi:hypothetical protein
MDTGATVAIPKDHRLDKTRAHQFQSQMQPDEMVTTTQFGGCERRQSPDVVVGGSSWNVHPATFDDQIDPAPIAEHNPHDLLLRCQILRGGPDIETGEQVHRIGRPLKINMKVEVTPLIELVKIRNRTGRPMPRGRGQSADQLTP